MGYGRIIGRDRNRLEQCCGTLMGVASGLLADRQLNDSEIHFLHDWLLMNEDIAVVWPGDVVIERVKAIVADGVITELERADLVLTLEKIAGGQVPKAGEGPVNQLAFDEAPSIAFHGQTFCVTGDFVFGPRARVHQTIEERGGLVLKNVTRKLEYLVVGLRGSEEWKHGSFGTKIEKAISYKRAGQPLAIVREDHWSAALKGVSPS